MPVIPFKSKPTLSSEANLAAYIEYAKLIVLTGTHGFEWNDAIWKFPRTMIRFTKLEQNRTLSKSAIPNSDQVFDHDFTEFSKAFLINSLSENPKTHIRRCFQGLQYLDAAMRTSGAKTCITKVSRVHLQAARELIAKTGSPVELGGVLQSIAQNIARHNLTTNDIALWKHGFKKKIKPDIGKLPSDESIIALAEIFGRAYTTELDDESIYLTSLTALLISAPLRISEQLWLPITLLDSDLDSTGIEQWFIKFFSSKYGHHTNKPFVSIMSGHARAAITRLAAITEDGRSLAKHIESGSTEFYLHSGCPQVPRNQILTLDEIALALGVSKKQATASLFTMTGSYCTTGWCLDSLWRTVREYNISRNPYFPYQVNPQKYDTTPLRMSESLMCFRASQLVPQYNTSPVILSPMNLDYFNKRLTHSKINNQGTLVSSFFDRHGYTGLILKSHQLRHFTTTAAQEGGLSLDLITRWRDCASEHQSRTYMHKDEKRIARDIADSRMAAVEVVPTPISREEYSFYDKGPVITTIYGICTHNWVVSPCEKSADCTDCSELLHCKGHRKSRDAIQRDRDQIAENLAAALQAIEDGNRPATRWVEHHSRRLERLDQLLAMHDDPAIPDGSAVMAPGSDFTHPGRILSTKHPEGTTPAAYNVVDDSLYGDDLLSCLKLFREQD
ncbi:hypothetical protein [Pseudomonas putida]|uniref:hypothetical protein n=1 Tax=Pseudomonas putida TaxID=303 RepID=UPI0018A9B462|nr:hypothetical protein [Pseudomonas putida]MBF8660659.1 hypothetical protein [Pseudomonas putida]